MTVLPVVRVIFFRLIQVLLWGLVLASTGHAESRDSIVTRARELVDAQRVPEAAVLLEPLLAANPDDAEVLVCLGHCRRLTGKVEEAVTLLTRARELTPDDAETQAEYGAAAAAQAQTLGTSLRALRLARAAREALRKAVALAPDTAPYREGLIEFYLIAPKIAGGDRDDAQSEAVELTRRTPHRGYYWQGLIAMADARYDDAAINAQHAINEKDNYYPPRILLARIALKTGEHVSAAIAALEPCLNLTPSRGQPGHDDVEKMLIQLRDLASPSP